MKHLTKQELATSVAENIGISKKEAADVLDALGRNFGSLLSMGYEITLPGIGKFSVAERAARKGRNPATGEVIDIPAKYVPHFSAAKSLKDDVKDFKDVAEKD